MIISFVVVADEHNGIGINNQLLCYLPADLKHFRQITMGHHVLMGHNTFQSIGKPLTGRTNIVLSRKSRLEIEGCIIRSSIQEAFGYAESREEKELMIIGGGTLYKQVWPVVDRIYLTRVHHVFEADTFFPEISPDQWILSSVESHMADEKNPFNYSFERYDRRK